ncbi:hypothetical protein AALA46_20765 [Enterocloster aldenensis]|uniref:hypothetical protein n=1 Tax=Enterocloster aldenensis TaxID=358742 RepID=UPI0035122C66
MNIEKEAVIKVKFNDYKMVSNFIKNDLGITKETVIEMVKGMVSKIDIEGLIIQKIERFVGTSSCTWRFEDYIKEKVEKAIDLEVKNIIEKTLRCEIEMIVREQVRQKMKGLNPQD